MQLLGLLLFQLLIIRLVGVGPQTDAYIAAQAVPSVVNAIIASSLQSVWLPRFSLLRHDVIAWREEQSLAQGQAAVLVGTVVLLLMAAAAWWVPALYSGFSEVLHQTTTAFSIVLLGATVLNTQVTLLTVALRASDRFLTAEVIALVGTILALVAIWFLVPTWGVWSAVLIWLARSFVIYILHMYIANWPWPAIRGGLRLAETWHMVRPLLFSASLSKTSPLVDRYWASQAQAGSMTMLGLAQQGIGALATVLERAISMPLIPTLARLLERGEVHSVRTRYRGRIVVALLATVVIAGVLFVGRPWLLDALALALDFSAENALLMWKLMMALIGFLFVSIAGTIVISVLYALGEMLLAAKISTGGFLLGLILKWIFFEEAGVVGLAIAITIAYLITFVMSIVIVELKLRRMETPP
jgi:peptidoglycan biosynthesis protein MviN/MurJ (putative lipid II flippase)